jgi:hypothetical protein
MTINEQAAQVWPILVLSARSQQILSYETIGQLIGAPSRAIGPILGPIQNYCKRLNFPPLTVLAVKKNTGLPGIGFAGKENIFAEQARVFIFDWLKKKSPTSKDFQKL